MDAKSLKDRNRDRIQAVKIFTLFSFLQTPIFFIAYWLAGSKTASLSIAAAIPSIIFTIWLTKRFQNPIVSGNCLVATGFLLFTVSSMHTGGLTAPALTWSIVLPFIATLLCGSLSGIFWFLMVAAKMSAFYFYEHSGHSFIQEYGQAGYHFAFYISIIGITLFTLIFALISEYYRNRYIERIEISNRELNKALENIKTLKDLVPICAWCKKARNDKGYWDNLEIYLEKNPHLEFSHGICPECYAKQQGV